MESALLLILLVGLLMVSMLKAWVVATRLMPHSCISNNSLIWSVLASGLSEVKKLEINPDVVDSDDVEMLEDLVCAAVNAAISLAKADSDEKLGAVTGGMNIPGMF